MINNNKARKFYNRPSIIHRAKHDKEHPFNMQSVEMYEDLKGKGLELLIMCLLLSNRVDTDKPTDSGWVVVKEEIRLRTGIAVKKFNECHKCWNVGHYPGIKTESELIISLKYLNHKDNFYAGND